MINSFLIVLAIFGGQTSKPLLSITQRDTHLYAGNAVIQLKGVNLGGWFVEEMWMTPWKTMPPVNSSYQKIVDHHGLWGTIEKRLGHDEMVKVRDEWRLNWITDDDFQAIKDAGFNHVRLPFLDSLLTEEGGIEWLHRAVNMAANHGLYTVLDMHGAPGGQSNEHHTGEVNRNRLWFDVENITKLEEAWTLLTHEFKNDPNVAMFDLMNEPTGAPNPAMLHLVYNRIYQAVRKVDPSKVVLIDDGYKGFETTPHPNLAGWTGICFSLHFYDFNAKKPGDHMDGLLKSIPRIQELLRYRSAPLYVGEWNVEPNGGPAVIAPYSQALTKAEFNWCFWTWKVAAPQGSLGDWGLIRPKHNEPLLNPFTDDAASLKKKIRAYRTKNMEEPTWVHSIIE